MSDTTYTERLLDDYTKRHENAVRIGAGIETVRELNVICMALHRLVARHTPSKPDPTPSPRRIENRVSALEDLVHKLSRDNPARITALEQRVDTLDYQMDNHIHDSEGEAAYDDHTPDQPAAPRIDPDDFDHNLYNEIQGQYVHHDGIGEEYDQGWMDAALWAARLSAHLNGSGNG